MKTILPILITVLAAAYIGWNVAYEHEEVTGVGTAPWTLQSIQLATSPANTECLKTDGTDNYWDTCAAGGSTLHVDGGGYVFPQTGDYHSAPFYRSTSTSDSSFLGNVIIGTTTGITTNQDHFLQVLGTDANSSGMTLARFQGNSQGTHIDFLKSRNATIGSNTIVNDNDVVGLMQFYPDDGVDFATLAARYKTEVDDTSPAAGDVGMAFVWDSMAGGGAAIAEKMRLDAAGNLTLAGTVDGVDIAARDHDAVTLAGTPDYITLAGQVLTRGTIDISDDTNLTGDTEIVLTGDALSIASTIARDSELHDAVTVSGTPDYITLSGQDIVRAKLDIVDDVNTFSSANLITLLTDETGTGAAVFGTNPTIAGAVGTGVWDLGGATSLELPNSAEPTVNATGEIAINTATSTIDFYDGTVEQNISPLFDKSFQLASTTKDTAENTFDTATTTWYIWNADGKVELEKQYCKTDAGTLSVRVGDGTNWADTLVANSSGAEDETISANSTFTDREDIRVEIGSSATSPKRVYCTLTFRRTPD
jgi:hypothetical protein